MESFQGYSLKITDHTLIMRAIVDRILLVVQYLDVPKGTVPTPIQTIEAALRVRSFDAHTRQLLQQVHDLLPVIEAGKENLPRDFTTEMTALQGRLIGLPVTEQLSVLDQARQAYDDTGIFAAGIDSATQILRAGADTLYSADSPLMELMEVTATTHSALGDIAATDAIGGTLGGGAGLLVGGPAGIPIGATAGGASASAGAITAAVAVAIFS